MQVFFKIFFLKWERKRRRLWNSGWTLEWSISSCKSFLCEAQIYYLTLFGNGHTHNLVSTLPNVVKIDVENGNVVSTFSQRFFINVKTNSVDLTLFDVVNTQRSHTQPKDNVEKTLKSLLGKQLSHISLAVAVGFF